MPPEIAAEYRKIGEWKRGDVLEISKDLIKFHCRTFRLTLRSPDLIRSITDIAKKCARASAPRGPMLVGDLDAESLWYFADVPWPTVREATYGDIYGLNP